MSSSISLGTSVDLDTLTSKSFTDFGVKDDAATFRSKSKFAIDSDEIAFKGRTDHRQEFNYARRYHDVVGDLNDSKQIERGNFYQEVDDRMSRNSVEYPEQQAKYVGKWLNDMSFHRPMSTDSTCHNGNVIGIRGFPKEQGSLEGHADQRAKFNKLKFNYSKLQTDYDKLRAQLGSTEDKFKRILKKRDHDINVLRTFVEKREMKTKPGPELVGENHHYQCCCCENKSSHHHKSQHDKDEDAVEEVARVRHKLKLLEIKLGSVDKEHELQMQTLLAENERLKSQSVMTKGELDRELIRLRNQVQALSLEPGNKAIMSLRNENSYLKDSNEMIKIEFHALKGKYLQLESKLKSLVEEQQQHLNGDKNDEMSKIMVELCRLQVYQPKLEATLETERAIKLELQKRIDALLEERDLLRDQFENQKLELNRELVRSKKIESTELNALNGELAQWHDKYYRLKKEKSDVEELLRASRSKVASLDSRHRAEMDLVQETNQREISQLIEVNSNLGEQCNKLRCSLETLEAKLDECTLDNGRLNQEVMELNKRLTNQQSQLTDEMATLRKLKDYEELEVTLRSQLELSEAKNGELAKEFESLSGQLDRSKQQAEQFRERFKIQQQTLDQMKDKRDKELARLRVSLNFERYNRQVALKGIEKELRCSLSELEAMKYRFSRRLAAQNDKIGTGTTNRVVGSNGSSTSTSTTAQKSQPIE